MWRRWVLRGIAGIRVFIHRSALGAEARSTVASPQETRRLLQEMLGGEVVVPAAPIVVEMLEACGHARADLQRLLPHQLLALLWIAVDEDAIVLLTAEERRRGGGGGPGPEPPPPEPPPPPRPSEDHWVEFRFRDAGGRPIAGARYKVDLPDGSDKMGKLDSGGGVRKESQPRGSARLELSDVDEARWSAEEIDAHLPVKLSVEASGFDPGEEITFEIFRLFRERPDQVVATLTGELDAAGHAEVTWKPESIEDADDQFLFKAAGGGAWRKSAPLTVHQDASDAEWSSALASEGDGVTLRARLRGVKDGQRAAIVVWEKRWRGGDDPEAARIDATVAGGLAQATWTVPAPAAPPRLGESSRRDLYFTVEAGDIHTTSGLLVVQPREGQS
jgi:hypothetical protein